MSGYFWYTNLCPPPPPLSSKTSLGGGAVYALPLRCNVTLCPPSSSSPSAQAPGTGMHVLCCRSLALRTDDPLDIGEVQLSTALSETLSLPDPLETRVPQRMRRAANTVRAAHRIAKLPGARPPQPVPHPEGAAVPPPPPAVNPLRRSGSGPAVNPLDIVVSLRPQPRRSSRSSVPGRDAGVQRCNTTGGLTGMY